MASLDETTLEPTRSMRSLSNIKHTLRDPAVCKDAMIL